MADQAREAVAALPGGRHPDHHVGLAAQPGEQGGEGAEQEREQARALARSDLLQRTDQRLLQQPVLALGGEAARADGPGPVGRQLEHRHRRGEHRGPVVLVLPGLHRGFVAAQPGGEVAVLRGGRQLHRRALGVPAIEVDDFAHQQADRMAVAHDVVRGQDELMVHRIDLDQLGAQQGAAFQVEGLFDRIEAGGLEPGRALLGRQGQQIDALDDGRRCGSNPEVGAFGAYGRAKRVVPGDDVVEGLLQRAGIHGPLQLEGGREVVGERGLVAHLAGQPDLALGLGRFDDALDVGPAERVEVHGAAGVVHVGGRVFQASST